MLQLLLQYTVNLPQILQNAGPRLPQMTAAKATTMDDGGNDTSGNEKRSGDEVKTPSKFQKKTGCSCNPA